MRERDRDVKKAVAWTLREISKKNPKVVYEFLQRYIASKDENTKWIVKEGSKKLPVVSRNNFTLQQDYHVRKLTNKDIARMVKQA